MSAPYIDTSALAKWYLNEPGSDAFAAFITAQSHGAISRLSALELRCLLARRRRAGEIGEAIETQAFDLLRRDIVAGHLTLHPLSDAHAQAATDLVDRLSPTHSLRALDALHLAIAGACAAEVVATADRVMADAAEALGFEVARFG
jgi:predicted nucleic acid-binding protein